MARWKCELWLRSVEIIRTSEAFHAWQDQLVSAFSSLGPPPTDLDLTGYDEKGGFGKVFFEVEAKTQFEAIQKRQLLGSRVNEPPLSGIVRITYYADPRKL